MCVSTAHTDSSSMGTPGSDSGSITSMTDENLSAGLRTSFGPSSKLAPAVRVTMRLTGTTVRLQCQNCMGTWTLGLTGPEQVIGCANCGATATATEVWLDWQTNHS